MDSCVSRKILLYRSRFFHLPQRAPICLRCVREEKRRGFTLIELSIVLVVIGLLVAAVTAGSSIVNAARLRGVTADIEKYRTAVNLFRGQYDQYPGDMSNATLYWSTSQSGNGDGLIGYIEIYAAAGQDYESIRSFQQMSLAGVIPGNYTGTGGNPMAIGQNTPPSSYSSETTYYFYAQTLWLRYPIATSLVVSGLRNNGWDDPQVRLKDAYLIDTKIDDGKPYIGKMITYSTGADGVCVATHLGNAANLQTSTYLTNTTDRCVVHFALSSSVFK